MTRMHKYSVEKLFHFLCYNCHKWWTISEWEPTTVICCPQCNARGEVSERRVNLGNSVASSEFYKKD